MVGLMKKWGRVKHARMIQMVNIWPQHCKDSKKWTYWRNTFTIWPLLLSLYRGQYSYSDQGYAVNELTRCVMQVKSRVKWHNPYSCSEGNRDMFLMSPLLSCPQLLQDAISLTKLLVSNIWSSHTRPWK